MGRKMGAVVDDQMNGVANGCDHALHGSGIPLIHLEHIIANTREAQVTIQAIHMRAWESRDARREGSYPPHSRFRQWPEFCSA